MKKDLTDARSFRFPKGTLAKCDTLDIHVPSVVRKAVERAIEEVSKTKKAKVSR